MKNKVEYKKNIIRIIVFSVIIISLFLILNICEYQVYTNNFNNTINKLVINIKDKYPDVKEKEIIDSISNEERLDNKILNKYGININNNSIISNNNTYFYIFTSINIILLLISIYVIVFIFIRYKNKQDREINNIVNLISEINNRNYDLHIEDLSEDELSILKEEIYKTAIMLKEVADNSKKDKIDLKNSLEDISHQIKTPLTSILIMLDNIIDNPDMDNNTKLDFIKDIRREIININFLVQELLKLSKFDSNTVIFNKKENNIKDIINESIKNVSTLCDLKNIDILCNGNNNIKIICDYNWQIEAITNILKNAVDYTNNGEKITIDYEQNNVYIKLIIHNTGSIINENDLKHLFERFYKGSNSTRDSIGIGLCLAKKIIEEDNGNISVKSDSNGTSFIIKYFK